MRSKPHSRGTLKLLKLRFFHVAGVNDRSRRHCFMSPGQKPSFTIFQNMFVRSPYLPVWTIFPDPNFNQCGCFPHFWKNLQSCFQNKISTIARSQRKQPPKAEDWARARPKPQTLENPKWALNKRMEAPGYVEMFSENAVWWILPRKQTFWKYSFVVWRGKFRKEYSCSKSYTEKVGWEILRSWKIGLINGWEKIKGSWLFKTLERVTKKRKRKWRIPVGSQLYLGVWCKSPFS